MTKRKKGPWKALLYREVVDPRWPDADNPDIEIRASNATVLVSVGHRRISTALRELDEHGKPDELRELLRQFVESEP